MKAWQLTVYLIPHFKAVVSAVERTQLTSYSIDRNFQEIEEVLTSFLAKLRDAREAHQTLPELFSNGVYTNLNQVKELIMIKCLKNVCKLNILDYISFRSCTKPLRNVDHLTLDVPFSRTDVFKNSFFVRICHLWNDLPLGIRESNTLSIFRKNLIAFYYDKFNVDFF